MSAQTQRGKVGAAGAAVVHEIDGQLSQVSALIGLYERRANSELRSEAELDEAKREMRLIRDEILSALLSAKKRLQRLQE